VQTEAMSQHIPVEIGNVQVVGHAVGIHINVLIQSKCVMDTRTVLPETTNKLIGKQYNCSRPRLRQTIKTYLGLLYCRTGPRLTKYFVILIFFLINLYVLACFTCGRYMLYLWNSVIELYFVYNQIIAFFGSVNLQSIKIIRLQLTFNYNILIK